MRKIVILDSACATQNDLNFDILKDIGEVIEYKRTSQENVIKNIGNAEIVVTNKVPMTKEILENCPNVKFITVLATGYNIIDLEYTKKMSITVSNVPAYSTESVVQHTLALILNIACGIKGHDKASKQQEWAQNPDFCLYKGELFELCGKTLGLIGYGDIGKRVGQVATALGMNVIFNTRSDIPGKVSKEEIYLKSDIISLHCPLNQDSINLINKKSIALMKNGVILVNTARGGLINEKDVLEALNDGKISYYAADVMINEPPGLNDMLITHPRTIITPHIAWATKEARSRLIFETKKNILGYINGCPRNVVNL